MSKILKLASAFICLLMVAVNVQAEPVRVFEETVSNPKSWDNFKKVTIGNGWADEQKGINVGRLSAMACRQAVEKNGLVALADGGKCVESFLKWNGLSNIETITFDELRTVVTGKGLYVASIEEMQGPSPAAKAETEKRLKSYVSAADSKVTALDAKVEALDESNIKFQTGVTSVLASINKKISAFQQDVESVGNVIDKKVDAKIDKKVDSLNAATDAQNKRVMALEGGMQALTVAGAANSKNIDKVASIVNRQSTAYSVGFGIVALFLVILGFVTIRNSINNRKLKNGYAVSAKSAKKVADDVEGLKSSLDKVQADQDAEGDIVDELSGRVDVLTGQQQELLEIVCPVSFDKTAVQSDKLSALKIGDKIELVVKFRHDDSESRLEVERTGENQITVHGALRQSKQPAPLVIDSLEGVSGKIYRASRRDCIVGVVQHDPEVFRSNRLHVV